MVVRKRFKRKPAESIEGWSQERLVEEGVLPASTEGTLQHIFQKSEEEKFKLKVMKMLNKYPGLTEDEVINILIIQNDRK